MSNHELSKLKFSGKLFVSESMCFENHQLAHKCTKLKNLGEIYSTWFYNNVVNIKLTGMGEHKIFQITDIEKLLDTGNLEEFLNRFPSHVICLGLIERIHLANQGNFFHSI